MKKKLLLLGAWIVRGILTLTMIATFAYFFGATFSKGQFDYQAWRCKPSKVEP